AVLPLPGCAVIVNVVAVPTWGLAEAVIAAMGSGSTVIVPRADGAPTVVVVVPDVEVDPIPAVAVTLAVLFVVSFVVAAPFASVVTTAGVIDPLSVLKVTGTFATRLPLVSLTVALTVACPPLEIVEGVAVS